MRAARALSPRDPPEMATLSLLRFSTAGGAATALEALQALNAAGRFEARELALASWQPGRRVPDFRPVHLPQSKASMGSDFWNLLAIHLFQLPLAVASAGLPPGSAHCSLADLGIRDDFLRTVRDRVTPGTSALLAMTDDATVDPIIHLLQHLAFTVVSTSLSTRQVEALRFGFGAGPVEDGERDDPLPGPPAQGACPPLRSRR